jgi:protein phosphatase PTC1
MIVRLDKEALVQSQTQDAEPEPNHGAAPKVSEADKIIMDTKQKIAEGSTPAVGVSASNFGRGYDSASAQEEGFVPTTLSDTLVEEPIAIDDEDSPELIAVDKPAAIAAADESKNELKELADV